MNTPSLNALSVAPKGERKMMPLSSYMMLLLFYIMYSMRNVMYAKSDGLLEHNAYHQHTDNLLLHPLSLRPTLHCFN